MGDKDLLAKQYLAQNDVFADAFNFFLFDGKKVIKPKELEEQDATELAVIQKMKTVFSNQKMRDVLKLCTIKHSKLATLVLLGIEAQSNVHYAMPVRDYLYDALNYASQVEAIRKKHSEDKDLKGDEYISGFSKKDRIIPVITLCICLDKKKWDAPRSLFDMFGEVDPRIREYVDDYKLNLITPDEIDDFTKFNSQLGILLEFIHNSDDKDKLRDIINTKKEYTSVDVRTVNMINLFTSANISVDNAKGGQVDMCQAIQGIIEDSRAEGHAKGRAEGRAEGADMLAELLKVLKPGSDEFNKALNATEAERQELYKKYNITSKK